MLTSPDTLLRIERAAVRAWPAGETADIQGWLWRATGGGSQRANSVSALDFSGSDLDAAIDEVEHRYRRRGAPPMFQVAEHVVAPAGLDNVLAQRGYRIQELCTTLAKEIGDSNGPGDVEIAEYPGNDWLSVYLAGVSESRRGLAPAILARVPAPRAFFLLRDEGQPMSAALGVAAEGVVIAECVATLASMRRGGGSLRVMRALEAWGASHGARVAALQAVAENAPAQALYAKLDYRAVSSYHYRVRDT